MEKQEIEIAGYKIFQLSQTEFEAEDKSRSLDFYFEINEENEVDAFVFNSTKQTSDNSCFIESGTYESLEEAVTSILN